MVEVWFVVTCRRVLLTLLSSRPSSMYLIWLIDWLIDYTVAPERVTVHTCVLPARHRDWLIRQRSPKQFNIFRQIDKTRLTYSVISRPHAPRALSFSFLFLYSSFSFSCEMQVLLMSMVSGWWMQPEATGIFSCSSSLTFQYYTESKVCEWNALLFHWRVKRIAVCKLVVIVGRAYIVRRENHMYL